MGSSVTTVCQVCIGFLLGTSTLAIVPVEAQETALSIKARMMTGIVQHQDLR